MCFGTEEVAQREAWVGKWSKSTCGKHLVSKKNASQPLDNTVHKVISASRIPAHHVTVCHNTEDIVMCHYPSGADGAAPALWQVTTDVLTPNGEVSHQESLEVIC